MVDEDAHIGRPVDRIRSAADNPGYATKRKGVRRPRWRNGYIEEWCPERERYVYQHRLVIERQLGRRLERSEVVHHINHDRTDNRPENLSLLASHSDHALTHKAEGTLGAFGPRPDKQKPLVACPICGEMFKPGRRVTAEGENVDVSTCSFRCGQVLRNRKAGTELVDRPCPVCGTVFHPSYADQRTCSKSCARTGPEPDHGTVSRYRRGCRCDACKGANTAKGRRLREARRAT